jgi:hypothetical protein
LKITQQSRMKIRVFWFSTTCPLVNISDISAKHSASPSGSISSSWRWYLPPKRWTATHQSTGCSIPEDLYLHQHRREITGFTYKILTKFFKAKIFALHHHTKRTYWLVLYESRCSEVTRLLPTMYECAIWSESATNSLTWQTGLQEAPLIMGPKLNALHW